MHYKANKMLLCWLRLLAAIVGCDKNRDRITTDFTFANILLHSLLYGSSGLAMTGLIRIMSLALFCTLAYAEEDTLGNGEERSSNAPQIAPNGVSERLENEKEFVLGEILIDAEGSFYELDWYRKQLSNLNTLIESIRLSSPSTDSNSQSLASIQMKKNELLEQIDHFERLIVNAAEDIIRLHGINSIAKLYEEFPDYSGFANNAVNDSHIANSVPVEEPIVIGLTVDMNSNTTSKPSPMESPSKNGEKIVAMGSQSIESLIVNMQLLQAYLRTCTLDIDADCRLANAYVDAELAKVAYSKTVADHNSQMLEQRENTYALQQVQTVVIGLLVLGVVLTGLFLAYMQFQRDGTKGPKENGNNTALKIGSMVEINSPVIGLLVLAFSLFFFERYISKVYVIEDPYNRAIESEPSVDPSEHTQELLSKAIE
jgi:hypothetical protein